LLILAVPVDPLAMRPTLLAAILLAVLIIQPSLAAQILVNTGDCYVVQFDDERGEKLTDFIALAEDILGRPIEDAHQEAAGVRVHISGPVSVPHGEFDQFLLAVLRAYGFLLTDYGPVGATSLSLWRIPGKGPSSWGGGGCKAPVVPVESLHLHAQDRATLITTSLPLVHVDACSAMRILAPLFDDQVELLHPAGDRDSLVITGFGTNVWRAYQLMVLVDVPPSPAQPPLRPSPRPR
jgi:hypothetical protein